MTTYGWHFLGSTLRDDSPIPKDGVWLPPIKHIMICERGYHGSPHPFDALQYAPGALLTYCEFDGEIQAHNDKLCAENRRIVCRMDVTEMLGYFARMQAVSVVHMWDAPDIVLNYLMTGDELLRDAARAAALNAARDAAWDAARDAFADLVYECFESTVNPDGSKK